MVEKLQHHLLYLPWMRVEGPVGYVSTRFTQWDRDDTLAQCLSLSDDFTLVSSCIFRYRMNIQLFVVTYEETEILMPSGSVIEITPVSSGELGKRAATSSNAVASGSIILNSSSPASPRRCELPPWLCHVFNPR